jgi:hypothetical protein
MSVLSENFLLKHVPFTRRENSELYVLWKKDHKSEER